MGSTMTATVGTMKDSAEIVGLMWANARWVRKPASKAAGVLAKVSVHLGLSCVMVSTMTVTVTSRKTKRGCHGPVAKMLVPASLGFSVAKLEAGAPARTIETQSSRCVMTSIMTATV